MDEIFSLMWLLQCSYSFSKSTKEVFSVQGVCHSPNTLPTIVHGQGFRNITWQPKLNGSPYPPPREVLSNSARLSPGNLHWYTGSKYLNPCLLDTSSKWTKRLYLRNPKTLDRCDSIECDSLLQMNSSINIQYLCTVEAYMYEA
jgi:hypothetical protein